MDPNIVKQHLQDRDFANALNSVPAQYRAALTQQALDSQIVFKRDPYYSKGRLQMTISSTNTFTILKGYQCVLFGYGLNDAMVGAGFPASIGYDTATLADTNLFKGGETNAAELELISGMGFALCPDVEPVLARRLLHQTYMSAGVNGNTNDFKWGCPLFWPSGSGLYGATPSLATISAFDGTLPNVGALTNGIPGAEDWSKDIDPILWGPKGQADSTFQVIVSIQRQVAFTLVPRTAVAAASTTTTVGTAAYVSPVAPSSAGPSVGEGTYIDFFVRLFGAQFAPRGRNR